MARLVGAAARSPVWLNIKGLPLPNSKWFSSRSGDNQDSKSPGTASKLGSNTGGGPGAGTSGGRACPRSPIAMAHFDYQLEVEERIREEGTMPDTEAAFEILANHRIRASMAAGEFDNLKGAGQPLNRTEDSSDISLKILKNANMSPEWVELGKATRLAISEFRCQLRNRVQAEIAAGNDSANVIVGQAGDTEDGVLKMLSGSSSWTAAQPELRKSVTVINEQILRCNNAAPSPVVHLIPVRFDAEVKAAISGTDEEVQHPSSRDPPSATPPCCM
eukprot:CAMPEP_0117655152 /NCGR_PEP_ID=MMETSP0804-20121206/4128_1 /TAXON_ID=1074897 /ORGANISM="Tetraselmis astigmatica, Strain CCMP880" /LENGTH=274 /DNA_ID=CAMNT_0005461487 /DNA_START=129 /DNA_END=953 /DNA_ORIENTATION=-